LTAGDMTKTALILIRKKLIEHNILPFKEAHVKIVNVVHDEILLEASKGYEKLASKILQTSMELAGKYFCKQVNMAAIPVISTHWEH